MKQRITILALILLSISAYSSNFKHAVQKQKNAVVIEHDSTITTIEVVDNSIIHVRKTLKNCANSAIPDYVTVLKPQSVAWKLKTKKDQVLITTKSLKVLMTKNGEIEFKTIKNKNLLKENNELTFIKTGVVNSNTVSQSFTAGDEGLFGLGQFQSGIMNWKNVPIRLQQDNQEIAIPFVVSTKNYGIYWHNYSVTDFNIPQHELHFNNTVDSKKNIRETSFTASKTGLYSFMVETNTQNKRGKKQEIIVSIDGENIVDYSTFWAPVCFSGQKMLEAGKTYKLVFQNTNGREIGKLFYNEPDYNKTVFSSSAGNAIDYYFVTGENPTAVLAEYYKLTGKAPMFAKSVFGFWQCRERYHNQAELLENAVEYRKRNIPVDNIVQDWFYWPEGTKGPEWDRAKYPNPKAMVDKLDSLNIKLMVSVWPEVNNAPLLDNYNISNYKMTGTHFLDFTTSDVQKNFYKMLSDSMFHIGVSYIWLDGSEPENKPADNYETTVGPFAQVSNCYSLLVTKAVYEGKRNEYPNKRVYNLTRSAYAGQQRYGVASWSGDVSGTWKQFSEQIASGLNFVMAGVPYWTTDIGGFFRDKNSLNPIYDNQYTNPEYKELLSRWFQFGAFSPVFRIHGYVSNTEIWRYGNDFEAMARKFIDLRYQLMPYIYSESWKVSQQGKLIFSPLVYQYPTDKNTWTNKDQFFLGESMMICAITNYKERSKAIYLPEGNWFNFWNNEKISGNRKVEVKTPLDENPVFVKAGSILPMGPKLQFATQSTNEPLLIKIYPGKDAEYVLYLDDNESYDYEKGVYSEVVFKYFESKNELSVKKGTDAFINFEKNPMKFKIEKVGVENVKSIDFDGSELSVNL